MRKMAKKQKSKNAKENIFNGTKVIDIIIKCNRLCYEPKKFFNK